MTDKDDKRSRLDKIEHQTATALGMISKTREGVASIAAGVAQNLAGIKANLDANGDALEQFDIFNQIWAKMFLKMIERIEQVDYAVGNSAKTSFDASDLEIVKTKAKEWFNATFASLKDEVQEEREAYIKELRKKVADGVAEAEAAEKPAKKEEAVAEDALRGAEQSLSIPGGQGSEIPPEAEIFGGG